MSKKKYDASSIRALEGLEPVRMRPGMYTRTENPNHIIQEVIDNAQDEVLAGFASSISVEYHEDGSVSVEDNGRGIPVDMHAEKKIPAVQVIFTILHSGGKFDRDEDSAYTMSGGLHGVGVSVTNALSTRLDVTIWRDGYEHTMGFANGAVAVPLKRRKLPPEEKSRTGTRVQAWPDPSFFEHSLNAQEMERYLRTKGVLLPGSRISWTRPGRPPIVWEFPGGLTQYLEEQSDEGQEWVAPVFQAQIYHDGTNANFRRGEGFDLALAFSEEGRVIRESYVNLIPTPQGGRHESGLRSGMVDAIRAVADRMGAVPKGLKIEPEDVWSRMSFLLSTKMVDVEFQNQTKDRMTAEKGQRLVAGLLRDAMELWLSENPQYTSAIVGLVVSEAQRRSKQAVKTDRKRSSGAAMLPGKLSDCESRDVNRTELFIVEGDSAGGCLLGSTMVALTSGKSLTIKKICEEQAAGKRHFGYTVSEDGSIKVAEFINARLTKHSAPLVRVTLDNGEYIVCTPDHPFMLRDGSYEAAAKLQPDAALMPLYRRPKPRPALGSRKKFARAKTGLSGYEQVINPRTGRWVFTHILADECNLSMGACNAEDWEGVAFHRHHVDFDKNNNDPTNIKRMSRDAHLELHQSLANTGILSPEVKERSKKAKQTKAFRTKQSARMKQPETRAILSRHAIAQWSDPAYKQYMMDAWARHYESNEEYRAMNNEQLDRAQREYWAEEENRLAQSERVKRYFQDHPEHRKAHSDASKAQWKDEALREWRAEETSRQWTPEFREKRGAAMERHYYERTMKPLKDVYCQTGTIDQEAYDNIRRAAGDRYAMRLPKFLDRFFDGSMDALEQALQTHNHRVVKVEHLDYREDVYDLEVPGTHNFALASGVFVHNSGKQGRDKSTQAILPIRGKLLNTWEVNSNKALESETVRDIAQAIGVDPHTAKEVATADLSKLRYGRIFIMADADVDGAHIQVLLLTLFMRHFPALVEKGHIWIARAPLYRVDAPAKKGSKAPRKEYALNAEELQTITTRLEKEGVAPDKIVVSRFKGLGEMNPEQLWETTMNPDSRRPVQIRVPSHELAGVAFDLMMVKKNAHLRRDWMEAEGHTVVADI